MGNWIVPATDKRHKNDFIRVPKLVYAREKNYIPRLNIEMRRHLSQENPYFEHAKTEFFVAYDDGVPRGRISAQIDRKAHSPDGIKTGQFGFLDAADKKTAHGLLQVAESWLARNGCGRVRGPFSLSINEEAGLLLEGHEQPAKMLMNYTPPWMNEVLAEAGYAKAQDLLAYTMRLDSALPPKVETIHRKLENLENVHERALDPKTYKSDLYTILQIYNDAWADNWGFVPMTEAEIDYTSGNLKPVLRPDLARIAWVDGKPAAMIVALPDLNEAIADLRGALFPFGWLKLSTRLKYKTPHALRVVLMGVKKELQETRLGGELALYLIRQLHRAGNAAGIREAEMSWVLEDNWSTDHMIRYVGGRPYKRYRIYEKLLNS